MVGLVIVCFFITQLAVVVVAGFIDDMNGTLGPLDPLLTFLGGIFLAVFAAVLLPNDQVNPHRSNYPP